MKKLYIGVDNGTSGTVGFMPTSLESWPDMIETPIKMEQSYTKKAQTISRVDHDRLWDILNTALLENRVQPSDCLAILERPLINPMMFKTTVSAARSLEATVIILECLKIPFMYMDSKEWQKELLPEGIKTSPARKKASMDIGLRLFPALEKIIRKHKDADGILIAEWAKRNNL